MAEREQLKRPRWQVVRAHFVADWPDALVICCLLSLFLLAHRFFEEVEYGGDAVQKWQFVRQWSYANDFSHATWTHHMARLGVNGISWVIQTLFGRGWRAYYIGPCLMAALQVPFVYALARGLAGRLAGLLAVLLITYLAMVHRSASQLLPDGYAGTCAIACCYLYERFLAARQQTRLAWLASLALLSFWGYLVKETFVFFYPGLVIAIWWARRSPRDVGIFLGILAVGLLLETAAYALLTDYWGRYAIIRGTHLAGGEDGEASVKTIWDLFTRYDELHNATKYLLFFALASALWLAVLRKDAQPNSRGIVVIGLSHVVCLTFLLKSIHPIDVWQGLDPRYMEPATPFLGVYAGAFLATTLLELWRGPVLDTGLVARYGPSSPLAHVQALWCVGTIAAIAFVTYAGQRSQPPLDAFARGRQIATSVNRAYARNLPILERSGRAKALTAVYDVYLDDRLLARDGRLPNLNEVAFKQRGTTYLVKDRSAFTKDTLPRLVEEGCYVEVGGGPLRNPGTRDRRSSIKLGPLGTEPPARCDALLAELTRR
jgi:hypothetical protein